MAEEFVHLHCHTDYSFLDGAARVNGLVEEVAKLGQPAVAITDHGNLHGAFTFYEKAQSAGIKPIIGVEAYITPGTARTDKERVFYGAHDQKNDDVSSGGTYTHMTMWAKNNIGLHNLFEATTRAALDTVFAKYARMDMELLQKYNEGVIVSTGCPSSEVQTRLRLGQADKALEAAAVLQDIYGKENFYVELMDHGLSLEKRTRAGLLDIARTLNAPLVATNDLHYVTEPDSEFQSALLAINSGAHIDDPNRFKFEGDEYYVKSYNQMRGLFMEHPEAIKNTMEIAEKCNVSFKTVADGANHMAKFPLQPGETEEGVLREKVNTGLKWRFGENVPEYASKQADYEISVILEKGFPGYFLVVADFISWSREQGIMIGPGRGSAAGSMVAYALGITQLDPVEHKLLFERFLNPERPSMPDIDVDIEERRRDEVIRYVTNKYGSDKVSQIITFNIIKAKNALRDSARILGYDFQTGDRLTKALPKEIQGKGISLKEAFNQNAVRYNEAEEFRAMYNEQATSDSGEADVRNKTTIDMAMGIEGLIRGWGVHAAGIIMSDVAISDVMPLFRRLQDGAVITQFEAHACEQLGLVKMDFLGLRNLNVVGDAIKSVHEKGVELDILSLPLDDEETYKMLATGNALGVFQLDSDGMRSLLKQLKPTSFDDISACIALYRPGPMEMNSHISYARRKNRQERIKKLSPELNDKLSDILEDTYGLFVYQEQAMMAVQRLGGYTLGKADGFRKAMGKKDKTILAAEGEELAKRMKEQGFSDAAYREIWSILEPFGGYGFNRAHSAAYAVVSYWTAYLKTHFPKEFMAALLTSTGAKRDMTAVYLRECKRMGIDVKLPDVNESMANYQATEDGIRFGMQAISNVGGTIVPMIIETRNDKGKFTSFLDFLDKVPAPVCNKRVIESLIKAGAFDSFGVPRRILMNAHEEAVDAVLAIKKSEELGQFDLFSAGAGEDTRSLEDRFGIKIRKGNEWKHSKLLEFEHEMLGTYISGHPLNDSIELFEQNSDAPILSVITNETFKQDGKKVNVAGQIRTVTRKTSKRGNQFAIVQLEDLDASVPILVLGKTYEEYASKLKQNALVKVSGKIALRDETEVEIRVDRIESLVDTYESEVTYAFQIKLRYLDCTDKHLTDICHVLDQNAGDLPVRLEITDGRRVTMIDIRDAHSVQNTPKFMAELTNVVNPSNLKLVSIL
ncbi:MAG: DNA polymerase III subunit alpha [Bifidobacteriaceae bacterium]|jgi:DNA polymerase-3 subunit alpha|nr:DNA polymerase III subunit alpha [Bifidobacteriaceae bacterium]